MIKTYYEHHASHYDQHISEMDSLHLFPYDGYGEILDAVATYMDSHHRLSSMKILDLGIGTGELYSHIAPEKIELTGIDFSPKMLEVARLKLPRAKLVEADLLKGMPEDLRQEKYDFIVATYLVHHMSLEVLLDFIHHYLPYLAPFGKMILADTLFFDDIARKKVYEKSIESWDHALHYHVYDQLVSRIHENLALSYLRISESSGVVIIENYHEITLQYEENLVQYKSNTTKWKSTLPGKKRE